MLYFISNKFLFSIYIYKIYYLAEIFSNIFLFLIEILKFIACRFKSEHEFSRKFRPEFSLGRFNKSTKLINHELETRARSTFASSSMHP